MAEACFVEMPIQNPMLIYTGRSGQPVIDVQTDGETVWLTQAQLVRLFDSSNANISSISKISLPFMGLLTFSAGGVTKRDVTIAKNYLTAEELKIMNKEPMHMGDWIEQLDH